MPFDFLKRKKGRRRAGRVADPAAASASPRVTADRGSPFDGLTEEWRLVGGMEVDGRLSDALNRARADHDRTTSVGARSTARRARPAPGLRRSIRTT